MFALANSRRHLGAAGNRLLVLGLLLLAACSNTTKAGFNSGQGSAQTVLFVPWGTGPSSLGYDPGSESAPDGPRGFVVDTSHAVHVLDALNGRIAVFSRGKLARYVTLPNEDFTDFDLDPAGGYVLADTEEKGQVVFITARGVVTAQVPIIGQGVDDPTTVTAISRESNGVWIELHHAVWLLVATPSGQVVQPRVERLGKPTPKSGQMVQVALTPPSGAQVRLLDAHGRGPIVRISAPNVHAITGVEQDSSGTTYVGLWSVAPSQETHVLAVVDPSGQIARQDALPLLGPTQNTKRPLRMGKDGSLYVMVVGTNGLTVSRYQP